MLLKNPRLPCSATVTDFIDHIKRSCDRALRNQSTDLEKFISSLKGKLKKFSTAFGTTFEQYVKSCNSSQSEQEKQLKVFILLLTRNYNYDVMLMYIRAPSIVESGLAPHELRSGSLIKLVYFSRHADRSNNDKRKKSLKERLGISNGNRRSYPILGGRLHFVKFETRKLNECLDFISPKQLHRGGIDLHAWHSPDDNAIIKGTGGGAYKFADLFKERLGVSIDKEDEMDCLVAGANFLLKAIRHEAFTHMEGQKEFVQIDHNDLFPYLLVNIGSGVSMIKIGLSASTIASSFGKTISENKEPSYYRPKDISVSLLRMISYNIGQISYLNALRYGIKRIFFGGFFIRGHAYTMDTISFAIHFCYRLRGV
ncbi:hypothetical protein AAC387_Pa05g3299 [Persea americana]